MVGCLLNETERPVIVGALGTSLTFGAEVENRRATAWPAVLQRLLRARAGSSNIFVINGAVRASSADLAALCFDEIWGPAFADAAGHSRPPRLDLAVIEYTWTSSPSQIDTLVEALHARAIPVVALLYYHAANPYRFRLGPKDRTPWKNADKVGKQEQHARVLRRRGVPFFNNSALNARHRMAMLTRSKRHLSKLGHAEIGASLATLIADECDRLAPPTPLPRVPAQVCKLGRAVSHLVAEANGFALIEPADGRTAGYVATAVNATLTLEVASRASLTAGFLSFAFERSWKTRASATMHCEPPCTCTPHTFDAHSGRAAYTYTQRSVPVWIVVPSRGECRVRVSVTRLESGRFMLSAVTFSGARPGNRSVAINSLYALVDKNGWESGHGPVAR